MGYLGAPVSERWGGRGLDHFTYGLIVEEVGRGDSAMRTVVSVQTSLVCGSIERWGDEEQKRALAAAALLGRGVRLLRAHRARHRLRRGATCARGPSRIDGGWRLSGQKMWISLGNVAEVALVFAQTDPDHGHRGLACFLVPTASEGFAARRSTASSGCAPRTRPRLGLDGVEVGDEALLGEVGDGFKIAMSALDSGRFSVAAGCVGICEGCVEASVAYATERKQFGVPIARFQLVQEMIADMIVAPRRRPAAGLARRRSSRTPASLEHVETSVAKLYATESSVECANLAIQVHGGSGYVDDYPVERYLRDARVTTLYEGTSQIQKLIIARDATGVDALTPG